MRKIRIMKGTGAILLGLTIAACSNNPADPGPSDDPAGSPLDPRIGTGTARVTGVVRSADATEPFPVGGVRVTLGDATTYTNIDGTFHLQGVQSGTRTLFVDGLHVQSGDGQFGQFAIQLPIEAGADVSIEHPVYLPFIPFDQQQNVDPVQQTIVTGAGGAKLFIPPGGARLDGEEYDGPIALVRIERDRLPIALPDRWAERSLSIVSIQPAGIEFGVPVDISIPLPDDVALLDAGQALWSLDSKHTGFAHVGAGNAAGNSIETVSGGARLGGWYFFTDPTAEVIVPCDAGAAGRACLRSWGRVAGEVAPLTEIDLPGATMLFEQLAEALASRGNTAETAETALQVSVDWFAGARAAVASHRATYNAANNLNSLAAALDATIGPCAQADTCEDGGTIISQIRGRLETDVALIGSNVDLYQSRFDRLGAALDALAPFYNELNPVIGDTLSEFHAVANEFLHAAADFAPADSPGAAFNQLTAIIFDMADAVNDALRTIGRTGNDETTQLATVCDGSGTVHAEEPDAHGLAAVSAQGMSSLNECWVVGTDESLLLASVPVRSTTMAGGAHAPLRILLDRELTAEGLVNNAPAAGTLTQDIPVQIWKFSLSERQGVHVAFNASGTAMAGISVEQNVAQAAGTAGVFVTNAPGGVSNAVQVLLTDDKDVPYQLSVTPDGQLFDFGEPVFGSFDVQTRTAAILLDAQAGERIFVERRCCDADGQLYTFTLIGPNGAQVPRLDFEETTPGAGSELFDAHVSGLHRVVIQPLPGKFADYEIAVHKLAVSDAATYVIGETKTGTIDQVGESLFYTLEVDEATTLTLLGVGSFNLDPMLFALVAPDGTVLIENQTIFFDGSSFSSRTLELPEGGMYTIEFRAQLDQSPGTGTFSFRIFDPLEPPDGP